MKSNFVFPSLFCLLVLILSSCAGGPATSVPTAAPTTGIDLGPVTLVWSTTVETSPLNTPTGITLDAQGNLYVIDTLNHQIRVFNPEGSTIATWGELGSGEGQFNFAWKENLTLDDSDEVVAGVTLDGQGNVYVADVGNSRIQKLDQDGKFIAQWRTANLEDGQPSQAFDLVLDSQGNIYTVDLTDFVTKYDPQGNLIARWGGTGFEEGKFSEIGLIAIDKDDNMYVADTKDEEIHKYDLEGNLLAAFHIEAKEDRSRFASPFGIAIDVAGNIYAADFLSNRIVVLDSDGKFLKEWGNQGADAGLLYGPTDIAVDGEGNIYVSEVYNNRIQKFRLVE